MHRVVLDTNVLVSGVIQQRGHPHRVVKAWENGDVVIITSPAIIDEVERVLNYPKIKKKYGLDEDDIKHIVLNLLRYSVLIDSPVPLDVIKEDPADNKFLSAALEGRADYIVSGDSHLLNLKSYRGVDIVTPKRFSGLL